MIERIYITWMVIDNSYIQTIYLLHVNSLKIFKIESDSILSFQTNLFSCLAFFLGPAE